MDSTSSRGRSSVARAALGAAQLALLSASNATARVPWGLNAKKGQMIGAMSAHPPRLCQRNERSVMLARCPKRCC